MNNTIKNRIDVLFNAVYPTTFEYKLESVNEFINNADKLYTIVQFLSRNVNDAKSAISCEGNRYSIKVFDGDHLSKVQLYEDYYATTRLKAICIHISCPVDDCGSKNEFHGCNKRSEIRHGGSIE